MLEWQLLLSPAALRVVSLLRVRTGPAGAGRVGACCFPVNEARRRQQLRPFDGRKPSAACQPRLRVMAISRMSMS